MNPSNADAWLTLAKASMEIGDDFSVQAGIHKALDLDPENGSAYLLLGYLHLRHNELPQALEAFTKSAQLSTDNSVSMCMVGFTYQRMSQKSEAEKYYRQVLAVNPKDPLALQLMASIQQ